VKLYSFISSIREFPRTLKHWRQRAKRGYSYQDLWNIDYWFMETMPRMLQDFKKNLHGCPSEFTTREDGTEYQNVDQGMKDWEAVIDRMIFCFTEMHEDTCSMKNEFNDEYHKQLSKPNEGKKVKDWFEPYGTDKEGKPLYRWIHGEVEPELKKNFWKKDKEIRDYRNKMKDEGFDLMKKYFWNLWD
jgi:hypothetical protein